METYIAQQPKGSFRDKFDNLKFWQNYPIKKILMVIVMLILIIGLVVGIWLVQQRQKYQSKASLDTITLSLLPDTLNKNINDSSGVEVKISAGTNKVVGVDLELQYGKELEAIEFISAAGNFDTIIIPSPTQTGIDPANKLIRYSAINKGTNNKDQAFSLGSFKFKAIATGSGQIAFRNVQVITETGGFSVNNGNLSVVNANYTIQSPTPNIVSPTPTSTPIITPTPQPRTPIPVSIPESTPATYGCTASYTLDPASPLPNSAVTINVPSSDSPNYQCVVLYKDNQPVSCRLGDGVGKYICTANSGSSGNHTLQLKFGQASRYPANTPCGQPVECDPMDYRTIP